MATPETIVTVWDDFDVIKNYLSKDINTGFQGLIFSRLIIGLPCQMSTLAKFNTDSPVLPTLSCVICTS
jgi:hypothetical protein